MKKIYFLSFLFLLLSSQSVFGADIFMEGPKEVGVNQQFQADIFIDTKGENINAIEGEFNFQRDFLEVKEISDGNSIVNFWIQRFKLISDNKIIFSGIIPAGYSGKGKIFSVVFRALKKGDAPVDFSNLRILLNDGSGTPVKTNAVSAGIKISDIKANEEILRIKFADSEPPENFLPQIGQNSEIFEGKYFLVFASQDKNSGISHYEVREERREVWGKLKNLFSADGRKWIIVESPYELQDQNLISDIYVKAVDRVGNDRVATIKPQNYKWYEDFLLWIIIMTSLVIAYLVWRKFLKK